MEKRKFDSSWRYFYAVVIALSLFLFGFTISYGINAFEFERVSSLQDDVFYEFYKTDLSHALFAEGNCEDSTVDDLSQALDFQGAMFQKFEEDFGKDNEHVMKRKKFYSMLQLSHFNFMKQANEECDLDKDFILFFYSNEKEDLDLSEQIGQILSHLKDNNPNVLIYSFDSASIDPLVNKFRLKYEVDEPIMVIVNDYNRLNYISNIGQVEAYL